MVMVMSACRIIVHGRLHDLARFAVIELRHTSFINTFSSVLDHPDAS